MTDTTVEGLLFAARFHQMSCRHYSMWQDKVRSDYLSGWPRWLWDQKLMQERCAEYQDLARMHAALARACLAAATGQADALSTSYRQGLEDAARVAEQYDGGFLNDAAADIAEAIRALITKDNPNG